MRDDLNKQLCERERQGSRNKYRRARRAKKYNSPLDVDGGNSRSHESMTFRHEGWYGDAKNFNENLRPLYGAIRKAVGRPWDKFYSELCEKFNMRSVINRHILQHLYDYCELNVIVQDGELFVRTHPSMPLRPLRELDIEFYVDPRTRLIRKNKWYKGRRARARQDHTRDEKELAATFRRIDDDNVLHNIGGIWYHFVLKPVPFGEETFVKPEGVEIFTDSRKRSKTWDKLQDYDRARFGKRVFKGKYVKDLLTGETLFHDGTKVRRLYNSHYYDAYNGKYHAIKKTASHKTLKKAGIIQ